jgi:archaellum component FlaG (FlaF/FlaG flagellin family)
MWKRSIRPMLKQNAYFRVINDPNEPTSESTKSGALRLIVWHTFSRLLAVSQQSLNRLIVLISEVFSLKII